MAGFDDFMRQRMANTVRGYETGGSGGTLPPASQMVPITTVPYPSPTPMGAGGYGGPTTLAAGGGTRPPDVKNPYPVVGDGTGGPMYRDTEERLRLLVWLLSQDGNPLRRQTYGSNMPTTLEPSGVVPSVDPGASISPSSSPFPYTGPVSNQTGSKQSGIDQLVEAAKSRYTGETFEDGSSTPSQVMSSPAPQARGPMNQIQQAAAVALMRMKGVI